MVRAKGGALPASANPGGPGAAFHAHVALIARTRQVTWLDQSSSGDLLDLIDDRHVTVFDVRVGRVHDSRRHGPITSLRNVERRPTGSGRSKGLGTKATLKVAVCVAFPADLRISDTGSIVSPCMLASSSAEPQASSNDGLPTATPDSVTVPLAYDTAQDRGLVVQAVDDTGRRCRPHRTGRHPARAMDQAQIDAAVCRSAVHRNPSLCVPASLVEAVIGRAAARGHGPQARRPFSKTAGPRRAGGLCEAGQAWAFAASAMISWCTRSAAVAYSMGEGLVPCTAVIAARKRA